MAQNQFKIDALGSMNSLFRGTALDFDDFQGEWTLWTHPVPPCPCASMLPCKFEAIASTLVYSRLLKLVME